MTGRKRITTICCLLLMGLLGLCSCGSPSSDSVENISSDISEDSAVSGSTESIDENSAEFVYESSMELKYAENFSVDYYTGGYKLLTVMDGTKLLVVPEGKAVPENLEEDMYIMRQPVENLYLVATAAMDMFDSLDAVDTIRLSGQKEGNWYIESANEAMADGKMLYAGKYNKPDYELIVSENCSLAIENMMISHSPEVIEMMEDFGIPVMIEYSSYESHPLGRVEWIKFFGALLGKEAEAEEAFEKQVAILEKVTADEKTDQLRFSLLLPTVWCR